MTPPAVGDRCGVVYTGQVRTAFVASVQRALITFELEGFAVQVSEVLSAEGRTWCRWDAIDALHTVVTLGSPPAAVEPKVGQIWRRDDGYEFEITAHGGDFTQFKGTLETLEGAGVPSMSTNARPLESRGWRFVR